MLLNCEKEEGKSIRPNLARKDVLSNGNAIAIHLSHCMFRKTKGGRKRGWQKCSLCAENAECNRTLRRKERGYQCGQIEQARKVLNIGHAKSDNLCHSGLQEKKVREAENAESNETSKRDGESL
jgi:hypothetical protein